MFTFPTRTVTLLSVVTAATGLAVTGCGSSSSSTPTSAMQTMSGMAPLAAGADGLKTTAAGYTLSPATTTIAKNSHATWSFRILDAQKQPVTTFQRDQTKLLHLIVAKRDLSAYQHLHPTLAADGTFSIPLTLKTAGTYRAIADFTVAGKRHVLGTDLTVAGPTSPVPLPASAPTATTDGYVVQLAHPTLHAGKESELSFTVIRGGKLVTGLQPYLGAYGHLVALRQPDLAYSHVHPTSQDRSNGLIRFSTDLPTAATYRLFLQFQTHGIVHTAAFTETAGK